MNTNAHNIVRTADPAFTTPAAPTSVADDLAEWAERKATPRLSIPATPEEPPDRKTLEPRDPRTLEPFPP